jgi:CheY-like chemotaxis protein
VTSILIIDDDAGIRRLLRAALERIGYQVSEAADGAAGVAEYRRAPSDLVITDVVMPGQDGIETIQQLREEFPDSRILAISGGPIDGANGTFTDARPLGANAALAKPFTLDAFARTVADLLGR